MKPIGHSESQNKNADYYLGIDIQHLIMLTQQKSFKMPSGLSREERRAWAKKNQENQEA